LASNINPRSEEPKIQNSEFSALILYYNEEKRIGDLLERLLE